jgi:hypothetical protein
MHGPPLTRTEVAAVLRSEIRRLVSLGVPQAQATTAVATRLKASSEEETS